MLVNQSLLNEELLAKIKAIQIHARFLVSDIFAGEYESAFKGRGMTFEEVREYQMGDDIRTIDWNVTARTNKPHVKLYRDERELTVMFVVDISASAHFGTVQKFKNEIAAEITALLAYTALKKNDKVGLIVFSDRVEHYLPPKKGRGHIWRLIRDILTYRSTSRKTDFTVPIDFLNRVIKRRAVTFLISDFQGGDFQKDLRRTSKHHDLVAIAISDPKERELPHVGFIELEDAETGEHILIDTGRKSVRQNFSTAARNLSLELKHFFRSSEIDLIEISTDGSYLEPIVRFFKSREKTKYGR